MKKHALSRLGFTYSTALLALLMTGHSVRAEQPATNSDCVILLHGLARTANAMTPLADTLADAGYRVANVDYPSRSATVEVLAAPALDDGLEQCAATATDDAKVHLVSHSLGGILIRYYLSHNTIDNLGRVVMMAPPNQGSEIVDEHADTPGFAAFNGPAGLQLGTGDDAIIHQLAPIDFELGVIAGNRTVNLILSTYLPNPDDGKVSVASTKIDGMADHLEVARSHTFIMRAPEVKDAVLQFLATGAFQAAN